MKFLNFCWSIQTFIETLNLWSKLLTIYWNFQILKEAFKPSLNFETFNETFKHSLNIQIFYKNSKPPLKFIKTFIEIFQLLLKPVNFYEALQTFIKLPSKLSNIHQTSNKTSKLPPKLFKPPSMETFKLSLKLSNLLWNSQPCLEFLNHYSSF